MRLTIRNVKKRLAFFLIIELLGRLPIIRFLNEKIGIRDKNEYQTRKLLVQRKKREPYFPKAESQLRSRVSITETTEFNNCTLVCDDEMYPAIVCFPIVSNLYYPIVPPKKSTVISFSKRETRSLYY